MVLTKADFNIKKHGNGFLQANPTPTKDELVKYYQDSYYQECSVDTYCTEYTKDELIHIENKNIVIKRIWEQCRKKEKGSFFDVGCGEGFIANYFLKQEWQIDACDFSSFGVEKFSPELMPFFNRGDVFDILDRNIQNQQKHDFINLANVLEHVVDPVDLLNKIKNVMHSDSLLRIIVPNDYSKFQELLIKKKYLENETWFCPPDHLNYFTFSTLKNLLISEGFKIEKMHTDFPIELFLINDHSNYSKDKTKGKQAHLTRVEIDNFLMEQGVDEYIEYMSAAANTGLGRSIIMYVSI